MKKWRSMLIPGLLVAALLVTGAWGYGEYRTRQHLQNRAESQYQKDALELSWHLDNISGQLAQLMVTSSREKNVIGLATLWRDVFAAQSSIGGLPLAFIPLSNTEKFLSDAGEAAFGILKRVVQGAGELTKKDKEIIAQLYDRSKTLKGDMNKLSARVLDRDLNWTEVETAAVNQNKKLQDNTILDGFELMEKKMEEYPELNLGKDLDPVKPDTRVVREDKKIDVEQAKKAAREWWYSPGDEHAVKVVYQGVGDIPEYGLEITPSPGENEPVYISVSKLDGTVIWAVKPRAINAPGIDFSEAERRALAFLQKRGFENVVTVNVAQEDDSAVYTFVPRQGEVLLYPDQLKVMVALDNGEINGFEGASYYMYHRERTLEAPALSEKDLRKLISPNLKVELVRPALISSGRGMEVLTWEVRGSYENEKFVIFYNAQTGSEEEITRITPPPRFTFTVAG
ncbi:MAG: germination protein YpeB [Peptococcaceae bacterium]|jgi:spore germination protein|nr:germination protein YpeB [Peptococcaceae bacterium]MDH7523745.1 germination protein YpeB [Peptococcaceae bacterium]